MRDQQSTSQNHRRSFPVGLVAGLSAIALVSGSAAAWWTWHSDTSTKPAVTASSTVQSSTAPSVSAPREQTVQVYWLKSTANKIELAASPVALNAESPSAVLKAAFQQILQKPADPALASAIPADTQLRNLDVKSDGVHVDLSKEFTSGGGSTAMTGRLGQIIYTATTLDPTTQVWISVEGKPLDVLGGEGLLVDQPMTRESFDKNFQL